MKSNIFYINNINFIKSDEDIDLSKIPSSYKRKLSNIDKIALSLLSKTYIDIVDEIVFSSKFGEFERLQSIISQYKSFNEVSPIQFSGSVHNYSVGTFNQINKINVPYSAISSDDNSISSGILKAIISEKQNVLFCYADYMEISKGACFIVSKKNPVSKNHLKCEMILKNSFSKIDEFKQLIPFLLNESQVLEFNICTIKKVD